MSVRRWNTSDENPIRASVVVIRIASSAFEEPVEQFVPQHPRRWRESRGETVDLESFVVFEAVDQLVPVVQPVVGQLDPGDAHAARAVRVDLEELVLLV